MQHFVFCVQVVIAFCVNLIFLATKERRERKKKTREEKRREEVLVFNMLFLTCCVCEPCPVLGLGGVLSPGLSPRGQVNKAQLNKENEDEALKQASNASKQALEPTQRTNTTEVR